MIHNRQDAMSSEDRNLLLDKLRVPALPATFTRLYINRLHLCRMWNVHTHRSTLSSIALFPATRSCIFGTWRIPVCVCVCVWTSICTKNECICDMWCADTAMDMLGKVSDRKNVPPTSFTTFCHTISPKPISSSSELFPARKDISCGIRNEH